MPAMPITPIPVPSDKVEFYFDNPGAAVDDIEYYMGLAKAAQALFDQMATDPGADPAIKAQAATLSAECARALAP